MGGTRTEVDSYGRGLLLRVRDEHGRIGRGEASPLDGYSPDSVDGCRRALSTISLEGVDLDGADPLAVLREASTAVDPSLPAARFAVETAILDLMAARRNAPAWDLLTHDGRAATARVAALVADDDTSRWPDLAQAAVERGRRTVKIKIARSGNIADEARALDAVRRRVGADVALRLDANGALPDGDASRILRRLARVEPDLLEEPVPFDRLDGLDPSPVPIALDESLQRVDPRDEAVWRIARHAGARALVLKPTALGGIVRCLDLARWAHDHAVRVVITHTFDGPVALIAAMALALAVRDETHGLDRHAGLDAWPDARLPMDDDGAIRPWDAPGLGLPTETGA